MMKKFLLLLVVLGVMVSGYLAPTMAQAADSARAVFYVA